MAAEARTRSELEIGHVLFMDVVGYSKLLINEQRELQQRLNQIVRGTEHFRAAEATGKLVRLPVGDGMALVFFNSPEAPVQCALEISEALKAYPELKLRMGIHSGPVSGVTDVNDRSNVAGAGINMAQRIMDCGDAGHILLSKRAADDLSQDATWQPRLHDLGECSVKHGVGVSIVNLYTDSVGNPQLPDKIKLVRKERAAATLRRRSLLIGAAILLAGLIALFVYQRQPFRSSAEELIPQKSVAVLPFENLSKDEENAFFASGVQDEILSYLAKIADLKVISRMSVMQYKNAAARNLREIAQQLGVAHVVEGSVQRAGGRVRVNAQLIDARTDAHLWAEHYDRDLADVFAIQSEIAKAIAEQLHAKISPGEQTAISEAPTTDVVANALYAQAKELEHKPPEDQNLLQAIRLLEEAIGRDPQFLQAYCLLGRFHLNLFFGGYDHTPARRELANTAIQKAARLRPDAGEVHLALARYAYHGFKDYDRARAQLDLARRTLPNNAELHSLSAAIDRRQGRWTEAMRNYERAVELDPRNMESLLNAGFVYEALRHYSEATRLYDRAIAVTPSDHYARLVRAFVPLSERADLEPLRTELSAILAEEPGAAREISSELFEYAMITRDAAAAARALDAIPPDGVPSAGNFVRPREWFVGFAARVFNDQVTARSAFIAARAIVEKIVRDQPDYAPPWALLGRIDAALGRKDDALREGRRACELLPLSKDTWFGPIQRRDLAVIYAWTGEKELALEQLALFIQMVPSPLDYGNVKLGPEWDALRGDPRFEKIVSSLAPK